MEEIGKTIAEGIAENAVGVIKSSVATFVIEKAADNIIHPPALLLTLSRRPPLQRQNHLARMQFGKM